MSSNTVIEARNRVARLVRCHAGADTVADARRELAAAKLDRYIRETVAAAPPLTDAQRTRLASLLSGGAA